MCKNGGACAPKEDSNDVVCKCRPNFEGSDCSDYIPRSRIYNNNSTANVVFSIFIVLLVLVVASALYLFFKKKNMWSEE